MRGSSLIDQDQRYPKARSNGNTELSDQPIIPAFTHSYEVLFDPKVHKNSQWGCV